MNKSAVFCSKGLGDGLIFSVIANNLKVNGLNVDLYHDFLGELQNLFDFEIKKYPKEEEVEKILSSYDLIIVNTDNGIVNQKIQKFLKERYSGKYYLLHATTCKGKNLPGNYFFDRNKTIVENLKLFCNQELKLKSVSSQSGIKFLKNLEHRKNLKRIVVHPTSKSSLRNWPREKFLKLSLRLQKKGFEISFIGIEENRNEWAFLEDFNISFPKFDSLEKLSAYIYESGYFLGNDSGLGHLASSLQIPTFTIFSSKRKKLFWRPDFYFSQGVIPLGIIPNFKGFRWREKYWKFFVFEFLVYRKFLRFLRSVKN
jgi:heptosyltransferase III